MRYDTAHGFAHKDVIRANGEVVKQPLFFETYNLAFTFATLDLKMNWRQYKESLEKELRQMTKEEMIKKNLDLHSEWMKYTFENPDVLDRIPKGAVLVILPEDDKELYAENYKVLEQNKRKGIPVFVVTMKMPKPQISKA